MSSRNFFLCGSDAYLAREAPQALPDYEYNPFAAPFDIDIEELDHWMQWEDAVELDCSSSDRRVSTDSGGSVSTAESWLSDTKTVGQVTQIKSEDNGLFLDHTVFELDEPMSLVVSSPCLYKLEISNSEPSRFFPTYSLPAAEEQDPRENAVLDQIPVQTGISCDLESSDSSQSPEPETRSRKSKKRKSIIAGCEIPDNGEIPTELCESRRREHNIIEKRYRTNLNERITCLRENIPSQSETLSNGLKASRDGKAAILTRALEYIQHLEKNNKRVGKEIGVLKMRVEAFEKLYLSGNSMMNGDEDDVELCKN